MRIKDSRGIFLIYCEAGPTLGTDTASDTRKKTAVRVRELGYVDMVPSTTWPPGSSCGQRWGAWTLSLHWSSEVLLLELAEAGGLRSAVFVLPSLPASGPCEHS